MGKQELIFELDNAGTEAHLVMLIEAHLMTPLQKKAITTIGLDTYGLLNGRWSSTPEVREIIRTIFEDWNSRLGQTQFGRNCGLGIE